MDSIIFFSTAWDLISTVIVFIMGWLVALYIRFFFYCSIKRVTIIYCWHAFFSIVYTFFILKFGGDAYAYYLKAVAAQGNLYVGNTSLFGTGGIVNISSFFVYFFNIPFIGMCLLFHIFGFIGLLAFDAALRSVVADKSKNIKLLATVIIFLPSVSFWSAGLGKDPISFMAVGLALWACLHLSKRMTLMIFAILLMLMVRPHMAGLMVIGLAASFVFQKNISLVYRFFLGISSMTAVAVLVPFALNYAGVGEDANVEQLGEYIDKRQGYNNHGGGGLDISSMSLPMQLFTYMFRPLPFEAHSIASFMASLDNMILLYLFVVGSYSLVKKRLVPELKLHNRAFMWYYCFGAWCILAMTTANLGIAVRQKWMIAPMLIFLLISVIGNKNRSNDEN